MWYQYQYVVNLSYNRMYHVINLVYSFLPTAQYKIFQCVCMDVLNIIRATIRGGYILTGTYCYDTT